jgi:polyphosphate kinase 2
MVRRPHLGLARHVHLGEDPAMGKKKTEEGAGGYDTPKLPRQVYEAELVTMVDWIKHTGARVVVIFEGRDAAGKGGVIKRITEYVSPRVVRVVALPAPTDRQKGQWYFQRYVEHLPAAGEMVIFDRSWYNRAGVEKVMGFCTDAEHEQFLRDAPVFERMLAEDGLILIKYWFSVSDEVQVKRFKARLGDPLKQWKLSPIDVEAQARWVDYSKAKDEMFKWTDLADSPWNVVESDKKRNARINCISHLLSSVPYERVEREKIEFPERQSDSEYERPPRKSNRYVPDRAGELLEQELKGRKG